MWTFSFITTLLHLFATLILFVVLVVSYTEECGVLEPLCCTECPTPEESSMLPQCHMAEVGELCEADGECGTDSDIDQCPGGFDVYVIKSIDGDDYPGPVMSTAMPLTSKSAGCTLSECRTFGASYGWFYSYSYSYTPPLYYNYPADEYAVVRIVQQDAFSGVDVMGVLGGILEVYINETDQWGTICDDYFTDLDATIACKEFGFDVGQEVPAYDVGMGDFYLSDPIVLDDINCTGHEDSIVDCPALQGKDMHNCIHSEDVALKCSMATTSTTTTPQALFEFYADGENEMSAVVRLLQLGDYEHAGELDDGSVSGLLQVSYNGIWGSVCNTGFSDQDAKVACGQLGYGIGAEINAFTIGLFDMSVYQPFIAAYIGCNASHTNMLDCSGRWGLDQPNCDFNDTVAIRCAPASSTNGTCCCDVLQSGDFISSEEKDCVVGQLRIYNERKCAGSVTNATGLPFFNETGFSCTADNVRCEAESSFEPMSGSGSLCTWVEADQLSETNPSICPTLVPYQNGVIYPGNSDDQYLNYCEYMVTTECLSMCFEESRSSCSNECDKYAPLFSNQDRGTTAGLNSNNAGLIAGVVAGAVVLVVIVVGIVVMIVKRKSRRVINTLPTARRVAIQGAIPTDPRVRNCPITPMPIPMGIVVTPQEQHNQTNSFQGQYNSARGFASTVAGGENNWAHAMRSTIGGGQDNEASDAPATVAGGGQQNIVETVSIDSEDAGTTPRRTFRGITHIDEVIVNL